MREINQVIFPSDIGDFARRTSNATGDEDWGIPDIAAVHGKWDGAGCTGMARCPLPAIWPRSPIPP